MAIAAITGKLRRGLTFDIVGSLTLASFSGYLYWIKYHVPVQNQITDFYTKLEAEKKAKNEA